MQIAGRREQARLARDLVVYKLSKSTRQSILQPQKHMKTCMIIISWRPNSAKHYETSSLSFQLPNSDFSNSHQGFTEVATRGESTTDSAQPLSLKARSTTRWSWEVKGYILWSHPLDLEGQHCAPTSSMIRACIWYLHMYLHLYMLCVYGCVCVCMCISCLYIRRPQPSAGGARQRKGKQCVGPPRCSMAAAKRRPCTSRLACHGVLVCRINFRSNFGKDRIRKLL